MTNTVKWTPEKLRPILIFWCNGATGGEIAKQTGEPRCSINYILDRVAAATNLGARSDLREHCPAEILDRYRIYQEEAKGRAQSGTRGIPGEPAVMSPAKLRAANEAFLALLEKHHGNDIRANG